jgi:hypothetical protein
MRIYFETLDGPATSFLALFCDEVLRRGEGILSKSMSNVRATDQRDNHFDFADETAGSALARFCIKPVVIHRLLDNRNKRKNIINTVQLHQFFPTSVRTVVVLALMCCCSQNSSSPPFGRGGVRPSACCKIVRTAQTPGP